MGPDLKRLWYDIKQSPAILITLIVVAALVIWYVYTQNNGSSGTTDTTTPTYEVQEISVTPPANSTTGTTTTSTSTGTTTSGGTLVNPPAVSGYQGHAPGSTFTGPTGVKHYVTTGTESLSQIAQKLGLTSYNSIYAIPENKQNGWVPSSLTAAKASSYVPPMNVPLVY